MIAVIAGNVDAREAERIVRATAPEGSVHTTRRLYYPYFWLELRYAAMTAFGRSAVRVSCMVDARTRVAATTDPFNVDHVDAGTDGCDIVTSRIDAIEARRAAERYTAYVLRNRRRAFVSPRVEVLASRLVYKPFWIVSWVSSPGPAGPVRVLVDGVTGGFHPLRFSETSM